MTVLGHGVTHCAQIELHTIGLNVFACIGHRANFRSGKRKSILCLNIKLLLIAMVIIMMLSATFNNIFSFIVDGQFY